MVRGCITYMLRECQVQEELRRAFPQFCEKQRLIDYYVSFDFPEKQMRMVGWWQRVIEFLVALLPRTYLTYQELLSYVSVYNLKPTPLPAIVAFLHKRDVLVPENQLQTRAEAERLKAQQGKSWLTSFLPFLGKAEKEKPAFSFAGSEKIFSKKAKEFKKHEVKTLLPALLPDHGQSIDEYKLVRLLEERCRIDQASVQEILKELQIEQVIARRQKGQKSFVLYSVNPKDLLSEEWAALESMKFCLREEILKFEGMIAREEEKAGRMREKAREQAASLNKAGAKATLREYLERQRKVGAIGTRKNVLQNQLTQLQYNEMNKSTLLLLEESQKVYQQTLIDGSRLDDAIDKNMEMAEHSRETNEKMEQMGQAAREENDEDVERMLDALSREVQGEKRVERKQVRVEVEREREKEQAMEIEHS